ncbi:polysaccharide deacetylase [Pseudoduganella lurida]|uniref:Polysaccharide deacetylase n=1 Tax=Pseudoduganella lurida TaxID=1036180 RepID=A0A562R3L4_9BURK|nr:polysaccharide deacetylase family protein [Pseudoduganella lurida]TWI63020.1 polysaccharide deacetylase [Pseudoduganella lurida]
MIPPDEVMHGAPLAKGLLRLLSPGGTRGLSILIYHRVLPQPDPLFPAEVDAAAFSAQLGMLKACCTVLPLPEAVRCMKAGTLPPRAAAITFDDGYADNATVALPILRRHGLHATFFVATGFLDGGRMWNDSVYEVVRRAPHDVLDASMLGLGTHPLHTLADRRRAIPALIGQLKYLPLAERHDKVARLVALAGVPLPDDLMMTTAQVQGLHAAGMAIGAHTINHPILARLSDAAARDEIAHGKLALEDLVGAPVTLLAYPNGRPGEDYDARHVAMARELRFEGAVSTSWGSRRRPDLFQLPRFTPWDRSPLRFALRLARNLATKAQLA